MDADKTIPERAKLAFGELHSHCGVVAARIATLEARIVDHARHDETARRLATIPGIGPITASLISATVGDNIGAFKSARHFGLLATRRGWERAYAGSPRSSFPAIR